MGFKPLDKTKRNKKGLWSPAEDQKLRDYVMRHGRGCWSSVPINAGLQRNGKSCRLRWMNYLRPGLKRGPFTLEEEKTILALHQQLGNKWSQMAYHLPGRTDNEIKNYWHFYLKKRVAKMAQTTQHQHTNVQIQTLESSSPSLKSITQNPSFKSFEQREGSLIDTDQSMRKHSFPKVLFSEWLSFDQFSGQNSGIVTEFKNTFDNLSQNLEDNLVQGTFGSEMKTRFNEVYVDNTLESMYEIS